MAKIQTLEIFCGHGLYHIEHSMDFIYTYFIYTYVFIFNQQTENGLVEY